MSSSHMLDMHRRNYAHHEQRQTTARNHYNTILNALPSSIAGYTYTILFYIHQNLPLLDLNRSIETKNILIVKQEIKFRQQDRELQLLLKQQQREPSSGRIIKGLVYILKLVAFGFGSLLFRSE
ncbi:hypothetical protein HYFRA_00007110 [Hymenoscyphus fraxineus]|uniref:Uncharacterized protein n=1 Tax=Hymenoscyphus fraxineus TaxID=746836 RepID=A0A9N9KZR7_9HELO|nr:hypothetical protein HYFRA_00007110 [Hymenoscyphus fraxineus]